MFSHQYSFYGGVELLPWSRLTRSVSDLAAGGGLGWEGWDPLPQAPRRIPFLYVGNGDAVAWVADDSGDAPVEYLSHDDREHPASRISHSLRHFLHVWERVGYLGPEVWLLAAFTNEDGLLDEQHPNVAAWMNILENA